ncbi:MAG: 2Fe-2S iron-sulfur cluster-binding protein [Ginsengibacter sp.]
MKEPEQDINFSILYEGSNYPVSCYEGEYRNLMVLINEKIYVEDFGECKGIGRCGTCLVIISSDSLPIPDRNEASTLKKVSIKLPGIRLSCQIMITKALNNTFITVVEERVDVR